MEKKNEPKKSEPKQDKEEPKEQQEEQSGHQPPPALDPKTGQPRKWPEIGEKV
jgi:hypothetical protein